MVKQINTHRDGEIAFKASKSLIKEFTFSDYPFSEKYSDTLCVDCKDWESKIKDECVSCKSKFDNEKNYYKRNGNVCRVCVYY